MFPLQMSTFIISYVTLPWIGHVSGDFLHSGIFSVVFGFISSSPLCQQQQHGSRSAIELFTFKTVFLIDTRVDVSAQTTRLASQSTGPVIPSHSERLSATQVSSCTIAVHLVTLKWLAQLHGYSEAAVSCLIKPQRQSTLDLYKFRWNAYLSWLQETIYSCILLTVSICGFS